MSAGSVAAARPESIQARGGATPTPALQTLWLRPVRMSVAKDVVEEHHYLRTFPAGTCLTLGVFGGKRLAGALTLGVGPTNAHRLVEDANREDGDNAKLKNGMWTCVNQKIGGKWFIISDRGWTQEQSE